MPRWRVLNFRNLREDRSVQSTTFLPLKGLQQPLPSCSLQLVTEEEAGGIQGMPDGPATHHCKAWGPKPNNSHRKKKRVSWGKIGERRNFKGTKHQINNGLREGKRRKSEFKRYVVSLRGSGSHLCSFREGVAWPGPLDEFLLLGRWGIVSGTKQSLSVMAGWTLHSCSVRS